MIRWGFLLFVIVVIAIGVGTIKLKRRNREKMKEYFRQKDESVGENQNR